MFITDAILSCVVALSIRYTPETKPASQHVEHKNESLFLKTISGYRIVLRDFAYMAFTFAGMIVLLVYQQQYSSFPVYLRESHNISSDIYGIMLSITGLEVVLFQFGISRLIRKYSPFLMMALAAFFFMVGFGMIGFIRGVAFFLLAVIVITVGEMIMFPTNKYIALGFAPAEMRGRYMAIYDLGWAIPATIGPAAAGFILDNYNPDYVWYIGGLLCAFAAIWFYALHLRLGSQSRFAPAKPE
ncbi:MAG: MFS transporter [Anaerolineales bacterium]